MKKQLIKTVTLVGLLWLALPAAAQVDGKWTGSMATPNGNVDISYTFKEDGTTLIGTTAGPDGSVIEISDGKVNGDNISFSVTVDFQGMPFTMAYTGVVMGNTIDFTIDIFGMPLMLTVTRADEA